MHAQLSIKNNEIMLLLLMLSTNEKNNIHVYSAVDECLLFSFYKVISLRDLLYPRG